MSSPKIYHGGGITKKRYSSSGIDTDEKAKVTSNDTTTNFLSQKITNGVGIAFAVLNPGGNEQFQISAPGSTTDEKVKVSAADTTTGFLSGKLAFVNLSTVILNPGANEVLQVTGLSAPFTLITGADTTKNYLDSKIAVGVNQGKQTLNPGGNEQLQLFSYDRNVKVTMNDTTQDYLQSKIALVNLVGAVLNPGGNEQLQITGPSKPFEFVSAADTTVGYLNDKVAVTDDLVKTILNPAGNEQLQLKSNGKARCTTNDTTFNYLQSKIIAGANITVTLLNPGGNEQLSIASSAVGGEPLYCMPYGYIGSISYNQLIPAAGNGSWAGNGQGWYAEHDLTLKEIWCLINRLTSYSTGSVTIEVRSVAGDGSRTTMITGSSGTGLATCLINTPNSGGAFRYYSGDGVSGLSANVSSDNMIFVRCSAFNVNSATGITVLTFWEKQPS